jgi:hypothetical protein
MAVQPGPAGSPVASSSTSEISEIYVQGIVAGLIGAATVAIWFFVVDVFNGRPFFTPNVLGTALFRREIGLDQPQTLPMSFEMVLFYTWVHGLAFCVIGGLASKLLALAERDLNLGFGILLFFVIFEFGFVGAASVFARPILQALTWPSVLVGNLLAAVAMAAYFWRHHPNLRVSP